MNKYIFKGRRIDNGEWIYGSLIEVGEWGRCIWEEDAPEPTPVIFESVKLLEEN